MNPNKEAIAYFEEITGGKAEFQYINWVDIWFYNNGYRITFFGNIVPERYWEKDGVKVMVRNEDVEYKKTPTKESELLEIIEFKRGFKKTSDFDKEFFQRTWGEQGYYENFSYGVGIDRVCEVALTPFLKPYYHVLEIGSGGGTFTERIAPQVRILTAIDVIKMPERFSAIENLTRYIELGDQDYYCTGVPDNSVNFAFSYNCFCHLSNEALIKYLQSVHRVLRWGGSHFVFMLSNYNKMELTGHKLGDLLDMGHFCQTEETVSIITDKAKWEIISTNMIPEHRDLIVNLKKK